MKVDFNTNSKNPNFGMIIETQKARNLLMKRLKTPYMNERYNAIKVNHANNPLKIILDTDENGKRLVAKILPFSSKMTELSTNIKIIKENWLSYIFKANPAEFLAEAVRTGDKL